MKYVCVSVCLAIIVAGIANARQEKKDTKAEIQAIFDHIGKAVDRKDIAGATKYSLATATVQYANGTRFTVAQWKEHARKGSAQIKSMKSRFVVEEVKVSGDAADATYTESHDSVVTDPKDKREHRIDYKGKWRVTMKKTAQGWRCSRSVELERKVMRDGKLLEEKSSTPRK